MKVEIYSDILCPWCYIGKRRVASALALLSNPARVELVWRSFELSPDQSRIPGKTAAAAIREWRGNAEAATRIAHIRALGAADGLDLNLDLARPVSTFDAHRLMHFAADRGKSDAVVERLFRTYHTEGGNVADRAVLVRLGDEAGIDRTEVGDMLASDAYALDVQGDERRASQLGITSVPSIVVAGKAPVSGIQTPAELALLIEEALRDAGKS